MFFAKMRSNLSFLKVKAVKKMIMDKRTKWKVLDLYICIKHNYIYKLQVTVFTSNSNWTFIGLNLPYMKGHPGQHLIITSHESTHSPNVALS